MVFLPKNSLVIMQNYFYREESVALVGSVSLSMFGKGIKKDLSVWTSLWKFVVLGDKT